MIIVAMIVGLMEVSPGICQRDVLNPDLTITTDRVQCEYYVEPVEPVAPSASTRTAL